MSTELCFFATLIFLAAHLYGERRAASPAYLAATKLGASTGFLATAVVNGAFDTAFGQWIFVGLALSWVGDACLLGKARAPFLAGLVAFLLGHVGYVVAFAVRGLDVNATLTAIPLLFGVALIIDRWLRPHVDGGMRAAVRAYIVVISTMLACAVGAWRGGAPAIALVGALAFYLSDLSVARERFVESDFINRAWGLPAYYLGQLCLAMAV